MKRKLFVASLLALLAVLVCTGAMAACSYTWTEGGVKYTCSGTHEYEKGSEAWNASMQNGDCRYFVYHKATTGNKWGTQTIIHSDHNLVIQYDSAQTTATCSTSGTIRKECSYCSWPAISNGKLPNQHPTDKLKTETKAATCVDDGYMKITCTACNTVVSNQVEKAHGKHTTASEPRVETEATCTTRGTLVDWCTVCDKTLGFNSYISALGHTGSLSVKVSPSCLTDGYGVLTCSRCKEVLDDHYEIAKLGHLNSVSWKTKTDQPYACCAGTEITYCPRCNTTMSSKTVAATADHTWSAWTITLNPTCLEDGHRVRYCTVCKTSDSETIPATGHPGTKTVVGKAATCTEDGITAHVCVRCGDTLKTTPIPATGHTPEEYERKEADCCNAGYYKVRCAVCKVDTAGDAIPPTGHTAAGSTYDKLVDPTCTSTGSYRLFCAKYHTVLSSKTLAKIDHNYKAVSVKCTGTSDRGYEAEQCSMCSAIRNKVMHTGIEEKTVLAASCCANGYYDTYCTTCGNKLADKLGIPPTGVGHKEERIVKSAATCTKGEVVDVVCTVRGNYLRTETGEPLGHSNLYTETVKEATCVENGKKVTYCGVCNAEVSSTTLVAPGHKMVDASYEATCTSYGWKGSKCSVCGYTEPGVHVASIPHDYSVKKNVKEATCTTDGSYDLYCSMCGGFGYNTPILRTGHTEGAQTTTKAATCCAAGTAEVRCTVCKALIRTVDLPATGKHAEEWRETTAATCTEAGEKTLYCANSGKSLGKTQSIPAKGHTEGAQTTTKAATCCADGTAEVRCTVCKALIRTVTLPATNNHAYEWRTVREATCTEQGKRDLYCANSGNYMGDYEYIPAKGHTEGQPVVVKEPTCCEPGTAEVRCTVCNELLRTETVKAKGHGDVEGKDYEWRVTTEATCTKDGVETKYCLNTGDSMGETRVIPAKGHTEGKPVVVKESTCLVEGLAEVRCTVCNELIRNEIVTAPGHQLSAPITVKEPTCCETGLAEIRCTVCGEVLETKTLAAKGHENIEGKDIEWRVTKEATCTENGVETKFCLNTGDNLGETRTIPAKGHVEGAAVTVKEPTCCETGLAEIRCTVCNELLKTETLAAKGHGNVEGKDYEWRVTKEPTCTENGVETKFCLNTGDSMGETRTIPATGHDFGEWTPEPGDPTMEYRICLNCGYAEYQYVKIPDKDCTHENVVTLPGYAPSCEEPGYTQHDFCKDCGAPVTLPTIIPATGHQNLAVIPAVPATPDQPGKTEGLYCADCGKVLVHPQDVNYEGELTNLVVNGLVVNPETGAQIGEVKDNVYTDMSGNVVGTFQPDGTLVDPQGNVIGDLEGNRIYDNGGAHVGTIVDSLDDVEGENSYTDVDGIVINPTTGEQIGEVNDNVYTDNDGNVIGTFQPDGTLVDPQGNVIGDLDGNLIYDNDGNHVGTIVDGIGAEDFIDVDGTVVDPETGEEIGKVEDNVYTDNEGNEVGTFQPDGTLVDPEGNVIGKLEGDYIYDNDGNHVGTIVDGTLIPGHPDFDLGDYLDEYYTHVEDGEKIRPTIDEEQCVIGSTQDVSGENTLISGAEDYAICPNDNYPLSQWIPTGDGNHVRVCTCATCDYSETASCVYFEITVNGDLYKICPICGHFGDEQYKHIRNVKVGVDGHLHELICRAYEAPFGAEAATVKDYADEAVVIADSFTACKSVKGELMAWGDAETLYIPMPNPGEVTLVRMDMNGEFENVPFMYFDGRIAFNAEDHGLYLIIAK